jgi:indolepyruvate ferredoxin oxidoreductase alpha subunit
VDFCEVGDPYDLKAFIGQLKEALQYSRSQGPAVVVARHPCIIDQRRNGTLLKTVAVEVCEDCDDCGYCLQHFECPALVRNDELERMSIDPIVCSGCGVCLNICPQGAIVQTK